MSGANESTEFVPRNARSGHHALATGVLAGTAMGVGLGLLFAPRRGRDIRKQVGDRVNHAISGTSSGYRHATSVAADWAHRGHDAYVGTCDRIAHGAHEMQQYIREVADAVTMKSHRPSAGPVRRVPVSASPSQGEQAAGDRSGQPNEAPVNLKAV